MNSGEPQPAHSSWSEALRSLSGTFVIAIFVVTFIVQAFQIPSESMENTLLIGDYLLVDKLHFGQDGFWDKVIPYRPVRRGDIIVFHYPVDPGVHFVKRVIGVPGDKIRLIDRRVYVNGVPLDEPYVRHFGVTNPYRDDFPKLDIPGIRINGSIDVSILSIPGAWWEQMRKLVVDNQLIIPEGNYFVMGDNRDDSLDSRYWGFVPRENIVGRPLLIYWSIHSPEPPVGQITAGDKLKRFAYALSHILQITRWDRTFRLVK